MSEQTDAPRPSGRRRRWRMAAVIALLAALIPAFPTHHRQRGELVELVRHATTICEAPGGQPIAKLTTRTDFGSPQALGTPTLISA